MSATPTTVTADSEVATSATRLHRAIPVASMLAVVLVATILPAIRNPNFYFWDDTAGVAVGVWQRIASDVLSGQLPFLQLDMWRGGNFIAEAATGMWNPVMLALMVGTYPFDDLAVAIAIAKIAFFLITAGGIYLLARSFTASPWMAALAGAVLPLSGWALFMDGTSWINGTAITAFTPWAWWAIRRSYLKHWTGRSIVVAAVFGYLLASVGNPYGMVSLAAAFLAVAVEAFLHKRGREIWWLVGLGVALLLMSVVIYLPFVLTSSVGFRANSATYNDEFLSPNLSNLLGMSAPTYKPYLRAFGLPLMTFPGMYLAWFLLPMLPWLRWRAPGATWRSLAGVLVFGGFYLIFLLGPTQLSMFRWPARLLPFLYLAIIVVFAVVASRGLHSDRRKLRMALSAIAVAAGAWMAFSDVPELWKWHGLTTVIVLLLGMLFLRYRDVGAKGFAILAGGMVVFLMAQLMISPSNQNVADYDLPHSRAELQERFEGRYDGVTVQVADYMALGTKLNPDEAWQDLLAGNMYSVAGVESTTAYSGVGYTKLDNALCLGYNGSGCSLAWRDLWKEPAGADANLADLLRAETVVVLRDYVKGAQVPTGWTLAERTDLVNVYTRDAPLPFPDGRVSAVGEDVTVSSARVLEPTDELVTVSTGEGESRSITFARLAWPGYSASVDGEPVPVVTGPAGLLEVELPPNLENAELSVSFSPPGLLPGLVTLALGVLLVGFLVWRRSRMRQTPGAIGETTEI